MRREKVPEGRYKHTTHTQTQEEIGSQGEEK